MNIEKLKDTDFLVISKDDLKKLSKLFGKDYLIFVKLDKYKNGMNYINM